MAPLTMSPPTMAPLTNPSPSATRPAVQDPTRPAVQDPTPPAVQEDIEAAIAAILQRARLLPPGTGALLPLPLYAALPAAKQMAALRPAPAGVRKVILATNIAETSVTIDGVLTLTPTLTPTLTLTCVFACRKFFTSSNPRSISCGSLRSAHQPHAPPYTHQPHAPPYTHQPHAPAKPQQA